MSQFRHALRHGKDDILARLFVALLLVIGSWPYVVLGVLLTLWLLWNDMRFKLHQQETIDRWAALVDRMNARSSHDH